MMDFDAFLTRVIDRGVAAATQSYSEPRHKSKLAGSLEGFEACRGKTPEELLKLLGEARAATHQAYFQVNEDEIENDAYWRIRCKEAEIEWICNCVSAALVNQGMPGIVPVTARGMLAAAEVLGVARPN